MAENEQDQTEEPQAQSEPSAVVWLAILGVLSLVAGGAGAGLGLMAPSGETAKTEAQKSEVAEGEEKPQYAAGEQIAMLPSIVTNLMSPRGTYIRLEGAVVFANAPEGDSAVLLSRIANDIMSMLNTMTLAHIEGASGLQHLREDLSTRAMIRSDGRVKEVVLHSLVVE